MNISLDYDSTYTADPALWSGFISLVKERGHGIYCVTARYEHERENMDPGLGIPIIFCNQQAKRQVVEEQGIHIHIWIDDNPKNIFQALK
jgi:hypothetical protein